MGALYSRIGERLMSWIELNLSKAVPKAKRQRQVSSVLDTPSIVEDEAVVSRLLYSVPSDPRLNVRESMRVAVVD